MSSKIKPAIGIYGGTFDPIHFGHLRPALEVCQFLDLQQVRFIPSYMPPHKQGPNCAPSDRLLMLKQALSHEKKFILDDREIQRQGYSYTIDTLKTLKKDFPQQPLCLILGLDAFIHINSWYQWQELLSFCHIIVTRRPETAHDQLTNLPNAIEKFYQQYKINHIEELFKHLNGHIYFIQVTQLAISSSQIRHSLAQNQSIRYLLPDEVCAIIKSNKLYHGK